MCLEEQETYINDEISEAHTIQYSETYAEVFRENFSPAEFQSLGVVAKIVCCVFRAKAVKSHEDSWAVRLASPWKHYLFEFKMNFSDWAFRNLFIIFRFMG